VLEAARWAASSGNEQPWRIFVARKSDAHFEKFLSTLVPFNQAWAKEAPVLLIMAYKKTSSNNGSPNPYGLHDAGQAFANLSLQAVALDLHVHGMAGFDHEKARQLLGIPEDFGLGAAAALGYLGSPDQLDERNRERERAPRTRKPLHEIVFGASWEEAVEL
jgi:nitroreductase